RLVGEIARREHRWGDAERALAESLGEVRAIRHPIETWQTELALGRLRAATGRPDDAAALLAAARQSMDAISAGVQDPRLLAGLRDGPRVRRAFEAWPGDSARPGVFSPPATRRSGLARSPPRGFWGVPRPRDRLPPGMTDRVIPASAAAGAPGDPAIEPSVRILPLGGLGEIGLNMMLLESGEDLLAVDCGLMFPDDEMPGVDYIIPDFSPLLA